VHGWSSFPGPKNEVSQQIWEKARAKKRVRERVPLSNPLKHPLLYESRSKFLASSRQFHTQVEYYYAICVYSERKAALSLASEVK
jgi:hypothetical protein